MEKVNESEIAEERKHVFDSHPLSIDRSNVTIWAEASVVAGEVNTTNNIRVGGLVSLIWWFTDLNGDGRINIIDIAIMAKKFGDGGWHPCLDLDGDGLLSLLDMAYVAKSYGRVYYEPADLDDP